MMYDEEENEKKMVIYKIMENFEDISNAPPDYFDIVPDCDPEIVDHLPKTNIKISEGLSSLDSMKIELSKLKLPMAKTNKSNKKMSVAQINFNDLHKVRKDMFGDLHDNEQAQRKLLLISEKYDRSLIDLKSLYKSYDEINSNLKYLYNNFQFLWTNPILNEKNKKMKIIEFLTKFSEEFKKTINNLREMKIEFDYLNNLKEELIKFFINKFQVVVAYIIHSRSFSNVDLQSLIDLN
jgi:hypothetical protein